MPQYETPNTVLSQFPKDLGQRRAAPTKSVEIKLARSFSTFLCATRRTARKKQDLSIWLYACSRSMVQMLSSLR